MQTGNLKDGGSGSYFLPYCPPIHPPLHQVIFSAVSHNSRPDMPEDDGDLPGNPGKTLGLYKALMERCWAPSAAARPTFQKIVAEIQVRGGRESEGEKRDFHGRGIMGEEGA